MLSTFRSSKLFRFGYGVTQKSISLKAVKLSTYVDRTTNLYNLKNGQFNFTRTFATPIHQERLSVEKTLFQLDQEVRSKGRISGRDIEEVLAAMKYTGDISPSQALLLIRCCGNLAIEESPAVRTELVTKVMSQLKKLNLELDISHYNALLKVYLENKTDFLPFDFLKELESSNLRPNRVTYQYLIGTFCIRGDITGATKILELMKENKVPINENIFNFLIMGHSEANDIESAADIINIMKEKGIEPSASSYAALLCGFAKNGEIEKIRQTLQQIEKQEIYLLDKDYLDIIYSLATNGHEQYVDEFIGKMKRYVGYNQDIVNLCFRLINDKKDDVIVKLIKSMYSTPNLDHKNGLWLIYYLMKNNEPIQRLMYFASEMKKEGINDHAALTALKEMLIRERDEDAIFLLKNMRECNIEVRPHYFYPLLCQAGRRKDHKKILYLVRLMKGLNCPITSLTVKNFIVPNYPVREVKADFGSLYSVRIHAVILAEALFTENVKVGHIEACEKLAKNFYLQWDKRWMRPLNHALVETRKVESYNNIMAHLFDSYMKEYRILDEVPGVVEKESVDDENENGNGKENEKGNGKENEIESEEVPLGFDRERSFGEFIILRLLDTSGGRNFLVPVLKGMLNNGIGVREDFVIRAEKNIKDAEALELLKKLRDPDLKATPITKDTEFVDLYPNIRIVRNAMNKGDVSDVDKHFSYLIDQKQEPQAEAVYEEFKNNNELTRERCALMVKLYTLSGKYDKACVVGKTLNEFTASDSYDPSKELYYVESLLNLEKYDEALEFFKTLDFTTYNPEILLHQIIKRYMKNGKPLDPLREFIDLTIEKHMLLPRHFNTLGFAYLERKEYEKAVDLFTYVATKHEYPVIKNQLLKEIVLSGNAELLEKLTNTLAELNGQVSGLMDLVCAFAEANKPKQVRRLLETPGLIINDERLLGFCKRFVQLGNTQAIECLATATKGMKILNRNVLYNFMLQSAMQENDPAKALNLWTEMQEEELTPTDNFLRRLGTFLKSKGLPVPFVYQESSLEVDNMGNVQVAASLTKAVETKNHPIVCKAISYAVRNRRFIPYQPVVDYLRSECIAKGKYKEFADIRSLLPNLKPRLTYESMALISYTNANNLEGYLSEKISEYATKDPIFQISDFPQRALIGLLMRNPEFLPVVEKHNEKARSKKVTVLSNSLWCYHVIRDDLEEAKKVFSKQIPVNATSVLRSYCVLKSLPGPLEKLLELRNDFGFSERQIQDILAAILTVYRKARNIEKIQEIVERCKKEQLTIPANFVGVANEAFQLSSSGVSSHSEEDVDKLEEEDFKDDAFEAGTKTGAKQEDLGETEEPKKVESKTGSI